MLDDFTGLGPVRRAALLDHFGSIDRLRAAPVEEIAEVSGFGPRLAAELHAFLSRPEPADTGKADTAEPDDPAPEIELVDDGPEQRLEP